MMSFPGRTTANLLGYKSFQIEDVSYSQVRTLHSDVSPADMLDEVDIPVAGILFRF
jgi:hypothetical protein